MLNDVEHWAKLMVFLSGTNAFLMFMVLCVLLFRR